MNSPKTRIEESGVRSSCETFETKSVFICDSRISRETVRSARAMPPIRTAVIRIDSQRLKLKFQRAHCSGVMLRLWMPRCQSVKTYGR
jgi:hypothetical protein